MKYKKCGTFPHNTKAVFSRRLFLCHVALAVFSVGAFLCSIPIALAVFSRGFFLGFFWEVIMDQQRNRLLKMKEVLALTALSKASVYDLIKRGQFPKQIRLGKNSVAWVESEVYGWINQKIEMNRNILSPQ